MILYTYDMFHFLEHLKTQTIYYMFLYNAIISTAQIVLHFTSLQTRSLEHYLDIFWKHSPYAVCIAFARATGLPRNQESRHCEEATSALDRANKHKQNQNIAKFYIHCGYMILESLVVEGTPMNEVHDLNDSCHRLLQGATSVWTHGLLVIKYTTIRKRVRFSNSLTEHCNDSRIFGAPCLESISRVNWKFSGDQHFRNVGLNKFFLSLV